MSLESLIKERPAEYQSKQCAFCVANKKCKKNCKECQHLSKCNEQGELYQKVGMKTHDQ